MNNDKELRKKIEEELLTVHGKDCYRGTACGYIEDAVDSILDLIHQEQIKLIEEFEGKLEKEKHWQLATLDSRNHDPQKKKQIHAYEDGINYAIHELEDLKKTQLADK